MIKPPINFLLANRLKLLLKQIEDTDNIKEKSFLYLRLYLLLTYALNNFKLNEKQFNFYNELLKNCIQELTKFFNCTPNLLQKKVISAIGKEVLPNEAAKDKVKVNEGLLFLSRNNAAMFKTVIQNGKVYYQNELEFNDQKTPLNTEYETEYVLSFSGDLYIKDSKRQDFVAQKMGGHYLQTNQIRHPSFLAGDQILCAGIITIRNNQIVDINNESGHYKPSMKDMALLVNHLDSLGVDITQITLSFAYPTFKVNAAVFLNLYPELQILSNENYEHYEKIRQREQEIIKILDLVNSPPKELELIITNFNKIISDIDEHYFEKYRELRAQYKMDPDKLCDLNEKINLKKSSKVTQLLAQEWLTHFEHEFNSPNAIAAILILIPKVEREIFNKVLEAHAIPPIKQLIKPHSRVIEGEDPTNVSKTDPDKIEKLLSDLADWIKNKTWKTTFRSKLGFFGNDNYPTHVKKILNVITAHSSDHGNPYETFEKILTIAYQASDNKTWTRSEDTQKFYDMLKSNQVHRLLNPTISNNEDSFREDQVQLN